MTYLEIIITVWCGLFAINIPFTIWKIREAKKTRLAMKEFAAAND